MSNIAFLQLYQFDNKKSIQINKKYCQLNNYKFINKKIVFIDKLLQCIISNIQKYDYLIIANQNVSISKPNIKIQQIIDDQHQIFMSHGQELINNSQNILNISTIIKNILSQQESYYIGNFQQFCQLLKKQNFDLVQKIRNISENLNGVNSDFIIIKCSFKTKRFFKECKQIYSNLKFLFSSLTNIIGLTIENPSYKNILGILNDDIQGFLNIDIQQFKYNDEKSFIINTKGLSTEQVEDLLKTCKVNKWWNQK